MSEAKHTPGPWIKSGLDYIGSNGEKVVVSDGPSFGSAATWPDAAANARLILAAPDLLDALVQFVGEFEGCYADGEPAMIKARAAIAKATGKTQ